MKAALRLIAIGSVVVLIGPSPSHAPSHNVPAKTFPSGGRTEILLQEFQALLPRFQAAIYKLPQGAKEARETLESALDDASCAITEGRDAVQGLRLSTVEKNDLSRAIQAIGEELATGKRSSARFEVVVEGSPRGLHPILRDEVYRITVEALRNAFAHAQAHRIEVEIRYGGNEFSINVRDDGIGISGELLSHHGREGHFGLNGMRERADLIGGKLAVWSELKSGTEVAISVPASKAYSRPPLRFRMWQKHSKDDSDVTKHEESRS